MPRHPPHAVWTPQQTNALLRIHSEEHASWIERGRPWGGYVFKNVATRLNAIPNLFSEPRTEMQCRMKLYSLKRARETSERRASEKQKRSYNWKQTSGHGGHDSSGESPRDICNKESTMRFDTKASVNQHDDRAHKRLRYHNHPLQRESINMNDSVAQTNSSPHYQFGNSHSTAPGYMNYPPIHSQYNPKYPHSIPPPPHRYPPAGHDYEPPPPPSQSHPPSHPPTRPPPSSFYIPDTRGYPQSTPYYNHTSYSYPPPPPGHPPAEWDPSPHTIVSSAKALFVKGYPNMSQTPQYKIRGTGELNTSNSSVPPKTQSHQPDTDVNKQQQQSSITVVSNESISPDVSPISKVSHPEYSSVSPSVPASLLTVSTSLTPMRSVNGCGDTVSSVDNNDNSPSITNNVKRMSPTGYASDTSYAISPLSDKSVEIMNSTQVQASPASERVSEHEMPLSNGKASSHEPYGYVDYPSTSIPPASPRYYTLEAERHSEPAAIPSNNTAYPTGSKSTPQDNSMPDRYWADTVRIQQEHERIQIELFDRNRRELFAYMEQQRESNQAQEERRWRRLMDLDAAREKKFCEREERLIATLESADTRRENQLREFEQRMREEAEARDLRWEKMVTTITCEQSKNYARIYEMLASYNLDLANDKSRVNAMLTMASANGNGSSNNDAVSS